MQGKVNRAIEAAVAAGCNMNGIDETTPWKEIKAVPGKIDTVDIRQGGDMYAALVLGDAVYFWTTRAPVFDQGIVSERKHTVVQVTEKDGVCVVKECTMGWVLVTTSFTLTISFSKAMFLVREWRDGKWVDSKESSDNFMKAMRAFIFIHKKPEKAK